MMIDQLDNSNDTTVTVVFSRLPPNHREPCKNGGSTSAIARTFSMVASGQGFAH